jgi:hypothetical protein
VREIRTLGSVRGEGHRHYGEPKRARSWKRRTQPRGYLQAPMIPRLLGRRIGHRLHAISYPYVQPHTNGITLDSFHHCITRWDQG